MSWRIRHLTSDGEKGFGIASRYACLVCGCVVAARVLAPLRLDEELWWFYALVCGGVLFGPLLGVLPQSWHGEASPWQPVARVVLWCSFSSMSRVPEWHARPIAQRGTLVQSLQEHPTSRPTACGPAPSAERKVLHVSALSTRHRGWPRLAAGRVRAARAATGVLRAREHMLAKSP